MKIVTTGHRGSVTTGDEIRGARNNKCRPFSYSLALLFSLCRGGEAAAAKLCQISANGWTAGTPVSPLIALQPGPEYQNIIANIEQTAWSATRPASYGAITSISGQALCTDYSAYINADYSSLETFLNNITPGQYGLGAIHCYCRRTKINGAPNIGKWIKFATYGTKIEPATYLTCRTGCAARCSQAFEGCANCKSFLFPLLAQTY